MSCCEIIPNGSVHWAVVHEDLDGKPKGRPAREKAYWFDPKDDRDAVEIREEGVVEGLDSVTQEEIGRGKHRDGRAKGHDGKLRVTLRFKSRQEAERELTEALAALRKGKNGKNGRDGQGEGDPTTKLHTVEIDIEAANPEEANTRQHPMNPYAQVCVVW